MLKKCLLFCLLCLILHNQYYLCLIFYQLKEGEKNNLVLGLLEHIKVRDERIAVLESELARLKKLPPVPELPEKTQVEAK